MKASESLGKIFNESALYLIIMRKEILLTIKRLSVYSIVENHPSWIMLDRTVK